MNILITGIRGFVGSNLVFALKKHYTIYGLDIVSSHKDGVVKTFGWNELEQIPSVDLIIDLAGKACILRFLRHHAKVLGLNLLSS